MAKCLFCERKSIFLRVNNEGYCKDCVPRVAARRKDEEEKKIREENARLLRIRQEEERRRQEEEERRKAEELRSKFDEYGNYIDSYFTQMNIKVSGVTFKNGRRSRQTILRNIYWKDDPYQRVDFDKCIDLVPTTFDGESAIEVWVYNKKRREQIGYISKHDLNFVSDNFNRIHSCTQFNVYGGGLSTDGDRKCFGCDFTINFFNKPGQGKVDEKMYSSFEEMKRISSLHSEENGQAIAYNAFLKKFPHACLIGCEVEHNNENSLLMYVVNTPVIVSRYHPDGDYISIDYYSDLYR